MPRDTLPDHRISFVLIRLPLHGLPTAHVKRVFARPGRARDWLHIGWVASPVAKDRGKRWLEPAIYMPNLHRLDTYPHAECKRAGDRPALYSGRSFMVPAHGSDLYTKRPAVGADATSAHIPGGVRGHRAAAAKLCGRFHARMTRHRTQRGDMAAFNGSMPHKGLSGP